MSTIGRFLEFSVRTTDILASLHFYKTLGFVELEIGEVLEAAEGGQGGEG